MHIGELLRQVRQEKGLSQRQLCGDVITRNMLSQIENGSARPSMDTLRYLAGRLEKPISYFLEEQAVSPNQQVVTDAREAYIRGDCDRVLGQLAAYTEPDGVFDPERWLLEAMALLVKAEQVLEDGKNIYARKLLVQVAEAGSKTPYYTPALERQRLLLLGAAEPEQAQKVVAQLPSMEQELCLRAMAALHSGDPARCVRLLTAEPTLSPEGHYLLGEAYYAQQDPVRAAEQFQKAEQAYPKETAGRLEECFRDMGEYKMAYYYACKRREMDG